MVFPAIDLRPYSETGCFRSHQAAWDLYTGPLLVFEDDAVFRMDFTLDLTPPEDWQILWLGGEHADPPAPFDEQWVRPTRMFRTHAYILRDPAAVADLMRGAPAIDPHLAGLPIAQYALREHTVGQGAGMSDRTRRSHPQVRFWQPLTHP